MKQNAADLKSTLSAIFNRKGRDGKFTRLFENLESAEKGGLLEKLQLRAGELPVIGHLMDQHEWLIITTERLIWHYEQRTQIVPLEDIDDAIADLHKLVASGQKKEQMRELRILTTKGGQFVIAVEEGLPLLGVWHALKNLGSRNRRKRA